MPTVGKEDKAGFTVMFNDTADQGVPESVKEKVLIRLHRLDLGVCVTAKFSCARIEVPKAIWKGSSVCKP